MASNGKCERQRLAEHGSFTVELCDCGAVHLAIGFVTLRLDPRAYRELARTVDEGLRAIQAEVAQHPTIH